jgi:hypothetical protein
MATLPPAPSVPAASAQDLPQAALALAKLSSEGQTLRLHSLSKELWDAATVDAELSLATPEGAGQSNSMPPLVAPLVAPLVFYYAQASLALDKTSAVDDMLSVFDGGDGDKCASLPPYLHLLLLAASSTARPSRALDLLCLHKPKEAMHDVYRLSLLADVYVSQGEMRLALGCLDEVGEVLRTRVTIPHGGLVEVCARQIRILLSLGDLAAARTVHSRMAGPLAELEGTRDYVGEVARLTEGVHKSLLTFAEHDYEAAIPQLLGLLEQAKSLPEKPLLPPFEFLDLHAGLVPTPPVATIHINLSLAYLYSCKLSKAIETLEECFRADPRNVTNSLVFNLCTLYDLACDNAVSGRKKRVLEEVVKQWGLFVKQESFRI